VPAPAAVGGAPAGVAARRDTSASLVVVVVVVVSAPPPELAPDVRGGAAERGDHPARDPAVDRGAMDEVAKVAAHSARVVSQRAESRLAIVASGKQGPPRWFKLGFL
jgi:hypothetical protein